MWKKITVSLILVAAVLAAQPAYAASVIYVDGSATSGSNTGNSWTNAFVHLQDALDIATAGDEIWVAEGIYYPDEESVGSQHTPDNRNESFRLRTGVAIYGGFDGTESTLPERNPTEHVTILSGDLLQDDTFEGDPVETVHGGIVPDATGRTGTWANRFDNAYHVVIGSNTTGTAVLDGFTITAGLASGSSSSTDVGGGILIDSGNPTLANLTIIGNGSIFLGGGIKNLNASSPTLTNVALIRNATNGWGGGIDNDLNSMPDLTDVLFLGNVADVGGGMANFDSSSPTLTNVRFLGNHADRSGGGLHNESDSSPTLTNVIFSGNTSPTGGGMANAFESNPALINLTLYGNTGGGLHNSNDSMPTLTNTIAWGNTPEQIVNVGATLPEIAYSLIEGSGGSGSGWDSSVGTDQGNNLDEAPELIDPDGADDVLGTLDDVLHLQGCSPAINMGDDAAISVTTDLKGDTRKDGTVDMGAYERIGGLDCPPPVAPSGLTAVYDDSTQQIDLSWLDNSTSETGFIVERSTDGGSSWATLTTTAVDATSAVDDTLACGQTFTYRVVATNPTDTSTPSNTASDMAVCPTNGSFEQTLSAWATNGPTQRMTTPLADDGTHILLLNTPSGTAFGLQTIPFGGQTSDSLTLTFQVAGKDVASSGLIGARLELMNNGSMSDRVNCLYTGGRGTFMWRQVSCTVTASAPYDAVRVTLGAQGVAKGLIGFDTVSVAP